MATYILSISYTIAGTERERFLALSTEMKAHFAGELKKNYQIFEVKGRPNSFVEQFVCSSLEEFDALEDDMTDKSEELVNRLSDLLKGEKASYSTLVEL